MTILQIIITIYQLILLSLALIGTGVAFVLILIIIVKWLLCTLYGKKIYTNPWCSQQYMEYFWFKAMQCLHKPFSSFFTQKQPMHKNLFIYGLSLIILTLNIIFKTNFVLTVIIDKIDIDISHNCYDDKYTYQSTNKPCFKSAYAEGNITNDDNVFNCEHNKVLMFEFVLFSHKLLRWLVPFLLITMLVSNIFLLDSVFYVFIFLQAYFMGVVVHY